MEYLPNYIGLMALFGMVEMVAKPKQPVNISDVSANKDDKIETKIIQEIFKMMFWEKSLYSDWGFFISLYLNGLRKKYTQQSFKYGT